MTVFSKKAHFGEVFLDHRAAPGIPPELALRMGYDPAQVGEGKLYEGPTLGCPHCGAHVVMNPLRTRERGHCYRCNMYVCDGCAFVMSQPDYVHRTMREIQDLVGGGKCVVTGGTASRPILRSTGEQDG